MITLKVVIDVSDKLATLIRAAGTSNVEEIMATLQDVVEATRINGIEARAAIARVAEDFADISQQLTDLRAQVEAGVGNAAELAAIKAGLDTVISDVAATTGELTGLDPVKPAAPPVEPPPA